MRRRTQPASPLPAPKRPQWAALTDFVLGRARLPAQDAQPNQYALRHPFRAPQHPPGVAPMAGIAQDEAIPGAFAWAANSIRHEGLEFVGYAYLAELAQRPEYRRISETLGLHMTRAWVRIQATGDAEDASVKERIAKIEAEIKRLRLQEAFKTVATQDGFFGRAHLYLDFGNEDPSELRKPIGDGWGEVSRQKIGIGSLKRVKPVEAVWCYPTEYNSNDPLSPHWYNPQHWMVMAKEIHASRLLTFIGRPVPDLLKPAYSFGGLSMSQMAKPYVDNWIRTRQSVADIVSAFSVMVLKTDVINQLNAGNDGADLFKRVDLFNTLRNNRGTMVIDKDLEDFSNVSAPLSGLDVLQAQTQEHMSAVSGIPIVILLGIQPAGLNASSDGELEAFYTWIRAFQEHLFRQPLHAIIGFIQLSLFGDVDPRIGFEFEPLGDLDEKELAEADGIRAQTDALLIDAGVIAPKESRERLARDERSPYAGINVDDVPLPDPGEIEIPGPASVEPGADPRERQKS